MIKRHLSTCLANVLAVGLLWTTPHRGVVAGSFVETRHTHLHHGHLRDSSLAGTHRHGRLLVSPFFSPLGSMEQHGFPRQRHPLAKSSSSSVVVLAAAAAAATTTATAAVGPRLPIQEDAFEGQLELVHANPDVFVIRNFLSSKDCQDIIDKAASQDMEASPVAYAGWTTDIKDLVELAAKGPVAWAAIVTAWWQSNQETATTTASTATSSTTTESAVAAQISLVIHMLQNFFGFLVVAVVLVAAFVALRANSLQQLRTSTSTTVDELQDSPGAAAFVRQASLLFGNNNNSDKNNPAQFFEAPTVIRYEPGQVLKPHYDANQSAQTEDANRGGQTVATLIVYLNTVPAGGRTRFGKLTSTTHTTDDDDNALSIAPARGDALLFFPADAAGSFDERLEHEGCAAVDEKWIARIWRHIDRVNPPFGLSEKTLGQL